MSSSPFPTEQYLQLLETSSQTLPDELLIKIKNDTFRTLMNDKNSI